MTRATSTEGNVYRKAAALCQREDYASCYAVNRIIHGKGKHMDDCAESSAYTRIFSPEEGGDSQAAWGERWGFGEGENFGIEVRKCRVLALCFMAALVEAGDA